MADKKIVWTTVKVEEAAKKLADGIVLKRIDNPFLGASAGIRKMNVTFAMTPEEVQEYIACAKDIHYFAENYCYIKTEDGRRKIVELRDYQKEILDNFDRYDKNILCAARQIGKTISTSIFMLHQLLFKNQQVALCLANTLETVVEILDKFKEIYCDLPFFLQKGVEIWNQKNVTFENQSKIRCRATSLNAARGMSLNILYVDEAAIIPANIIQRFYTAVIPTASAIEGSKIILTSTPYGQNVFYDYLMAAELPEDDPNKSPFHAKRVYWYQVPGRFVSYVRLNLKALELHKITKEELFDYITEIAPINKVEMRYDAIKNKEVINIYHKNEEGNVSEEDVLKIEYKGIRLVELADITTWKDEAIKLIGGEDAFSQEYDLKFVNTSRALLNEMTTERLNKNKIDYEWEQLDEMERRLEWSYKDLTWNTDQEKFVPILRKQYKILVTVDIAEGLGKDYSIINIFRVAPKSIDEILKHRTKMKTYKDFFFLDQIGFYRSNVIAIEKLAELLYIICFEYFNEDNVKVIVEYNTYGGQLITEMPHVFNDNNEYGSGIFLRFKHSIDAIHEKIGYKVVGGQDGKNLMVKKFQDAVYNGNINITNPICIYETTTFVKQQSKAGNIVYKSETGNDDAVMSCIHAATFIDKLAYTEICDELMSQITDTEWVTLAKNLMNENYTTSDVADYSSINKINRQRKYIKRNLNTGTNNGNDWFGLNKR